VDELTELPGIGQAKAVQVKAALGLARRLAESTAGERPRLNSPQDVANLMREAFRGRCQEEFHALLLDTKNGLLRDECVTVGLLDRSQVHAREVFRTAIRESCSRILLCHNHPSGDPTPSVQDVSCTRSLAAAGKVVGIEILDHVVIGHRSSSCPTGFVSLREEGLFTES
jgi:DNA repair protein RadC